MRLACGVTRPVSACQMEIQADHLRRDLRTAGVTRAVLFERTNVRRPAPSGCTTCEPRSSQ
jgi:hypothetical protein